MAVLDVIIPIRAFLNLDHLAVITPEVFEEDTIVGKIVKFNGLQMDGLLPFEAAEDLIELEEP